MFRFHKTPCVPLSVSNRPLGLSKCPFVSPVAGPPRLLRLALQRVKTVVTSQTDATCGDCVSLWHGFRNSIQASIFRIVRQTHGGNSLIDIRQEPVISMAEATTYVPRRRKGRKVSPGTVYRWASRGIRGVRLETIRIGGIALHERSCVAEVFWPAERSGLEGTCAGRRCNSQPVGGKTQVGRVRLVSCGRLGEAAAQNDVVEVRHQERPHDGGGGRMCLPDAAHLKSRICRIVPCVCAT